MRKHRKSHGASKATGRVAGYLEDKVCLAQGRTYVFNSSISQYAEIRIQPSFLGDRAIAVADLYALWRPRSVRFRSITLGGNANVCIGHLYPDALSAGITTMEEFVDTPACKFGNGAFGSPLPDLLLEEAYWRETGMTQWYTTTTIPTDQLLENAGVLVYGNENATMTAQNFRGVIEWEFEFKSMVDPQVSLARLEARRASSEIKVDEGYLTCPKSEVGVQIGATTCSAARTEGDKSTNNNLVAFRGTSVFQGAHPLRALRGSFRKC